MQVIVPPLNLGVNPVLLVAENGLDRVVPDERVRPQIPVPDDVIGCFGDELEALVSGAHGTLSFALVRYVDDGGDRRDDPSFRVAHRGRTHTNKAIGAVSTADPDLFGAHRFTGYHGARNGPLDRRVAGTIVLEPLPVITLEIGRRFECRAEYFGHLRVHRDEATRWDFRDDDANRHLLLNRVGERALGDQSELRVVCRPFGDSPLNLRCSGEGERRHDIDVSLCPVTWFFIEGAERADNGAAGGAQRNARVAANAGAAIRKTRLIPGVGEDDRVSASDHVLRVAAIEGNPGCGFRVARPGAALEVLAGLVDERDDHSWHADNLRGETRKTVQSFLGRRFQESAVMECGEPLGAG